MRAIQKPTLFTGETRSLRPRCQRTLVLVGAYAMTAMLAGACGSDTPAVAGRSAIDVTDLFSEMVVAGDWSGGAELYTADATWQFVSPTDSSPPIRLADELPPEAEVADWDGDGLTTELDFFTSLGAEVYAGGLTAILSCEQADAETAVCEESREGYAFENPSHSANWTITLADGLIRSIFIDVTGDGENTIKVLDFQEWVQENDPEVAADLFAGRANRIITPDNVETHRRLATEWLATQ